MSTTKAPHEQAVSALRSLPGTLPNDSKAARIRDLLPEIEAAMQRGTPQIEILNGLSSAGISMTLDELRNAIYRARKRLKKPQEAREKSKTAAPQQIPTPPIQAATHPVITDNPAAAWQASRDNPERW